MLTLDLEPALDLGPWTLDLGPWTYAEYLNLFLSCEGTREASHKVGQANNIAQNREK